MDTWINEQTNYTLISGSPTAIKYKFIQQLKLTTTARRKKLINFRKKRVFNGNCYSNGEEMYN